MSKDYLSDRIDTSRIWLSLEDIATKCRYDPSHCRWCFSPHENEQSSIINSLEDQLAPGFLESKSSSYVFLSEVYFRVALRRQHLEEETIRLPHDILLNFVDSNHLEFLKNHLKDAEYTLFAVCGTLFYHSKTTSHIGVRGFNVCTVKEEVCTQLQLYDQLCLLQKAKMMHAHRVHCLEQRSELDNSAMQ